MIFSMVLDFSSTHSLFPGYSDIQLLHSSGDRFYFQVSKNGNIFFGKVGILSDRKLVNEIGILKTLEHPYVPKIIDVFLQDTSISFITPFYEKKDPSIHELVILSINHIHICMAFDISSTVLRKFFIKKSFHQKMISVFLNKFSSWYSEIILLKILSTLDEMPTCFMHWDCRLGHILYNTSSSILIDWEEAWLYYKYYDIITLFQSLAFHKDFGFIQAVNYLQSAFFWVCPQISWKHISALILYHLLSSFDLEVNFNTIKTTNTLLEYALNISQKDNFLNFS